MYKKILPLLMFFALFLNAFSLQAQQSKSVAQIKYKISNYKNPSVFKTRFGLTRFSADDKMLAVIGDDYRIVIYQTETGKLLQSIKYGGDGTTNFSFGADGKSVLMLNRLFSEIEIWDLETGKLLKKINERSVVSGLKKVLINNVERKGQGQEMGELPISPDGKSILVARTDSRYDVVNLSDDTARFSLEQNSKTSETKDLLKILFVPGAATTRGFFRVSSAEYNAQGTRILLANGDKSPTLWDAENGKLISALEPQLSKVYDISFNHDGTLAATTDTKGVTKIWDAENGNLLSTIGTPKKRETAFGWSSQSEIIATLSSSEEGHFYNARTGKLLSSTGKTQINGLMFNPDGTLVATFAKKDRKLLGQIIRVANGKLIANLSRTVNEEHPLAIDWSKDGKFLAISSVEYVKIFNEKGELLQKLDQAVFPAQFSHDSKLLLTGGNNDDGFVWQIGEN